MSRHMHDAWVTTPHKVRHSHMHAVNEACSAYPKLRLMRMTAAELSCSAVWLTLRTVVMCSGTITP